MYSLSTCYNCNLYLESQPTVTIKKHLGQSELFDTTTVCNFCVRCFNSSSDDKLRRKTSGICVYCDKKIHDKTEFYYCAHHQFTEFGHMHSHCYKENINIFPEYKTYVWDSLSNNGAVQSILQGTQHVMNQNLQGPSPMIVSP